MEIIIPSAGRAKTVLTNIAGQKLCVPESEASNYRRHNACEIITHPPLKNLAAKRQWIYEKFGSVFMIDDDIKYVSPVYLPGNNRKNHLSPAEAAELIQATGQAAADAGCFLFGFNRAPNPKHYNAAKPIMLTGYINACAFGLHPSEKLFFTERTTAAESHWINLLNAYYHRRAWIDTRFHFAQAPNSTFFRPGGQTARRTLDSEKADSLYLRAVFGNAIRIKRNRATDAAGIHQYQRSIRIDL
jgi:hypothetical protein